MEIIARVDNVIFANSENNFKILSVETADKILTVSGYFGELREDIEYQFSVTEKIHPTYGKQYEAFAYQVYFPSKQVEIENFLASGFITGIGESTAKKIVKKFGEQSLQIIKNQPQKLKQIEGIGDATCQKIIKSIKEQLGREDIFIFLNNLEVSLKLAQAIYQQYGENTIAVIENNPYQLLGEFNGLSFKKIDKIAFRLGFVKDSKERLAALVNYILSNFSSQGHIYMPVDLLIEQFQYQLDFTVEEIEELLLDLAQRQKIIYDPKNKRVYSKYMADLEIGIMQNILRLLTSPLTELSIEGYLPQFKLTKEQQQAVDKGLNQAIYILTGGPGTGKTTILKEWVRRLEKLNQTYSLCAPTGRAASRMEDVINRPASTIHRLLEFQYESEAGRIFFNRSASNPLESDFIFVDEASMLDAPLFYNLLLAIKSGSHLIMIGDINQLPAVGPGAVLADLLATPIARTKLEQIHRQAADSLILNNAHAILKAEPLKINKKAGDFYFIQEGRVHKIIEQLKNMVEKRLPSYYSIKASDITVLTPLRNGVLGCETLNQELQAELNPDKELHYKRFRIGDKVIQNKNNYALEWTRKYSFEKGQGVFNGEIGKVVAFNKKGLHVDFSDEKTAIYNPEAAVDLKLAYALTVHKSQGNEFDYLVLVLPNLPPLLRSRHLLYTAITRAKKHLTIIGDWQNFQQLVLSEQDQKRYSALSERLEEAIVE